jgi:hypothetical protein
MMKMTSKTFKDWVHEAVINTCDLGFGPPTDVSVIKDQTGLIGRIMDSIDNFFHPEWGTVIVDHRS